VNDDFVKGVQSKFVETIAGRNTEEDISGLELTLTKYIEVYLRKKQYINHWTAESTCTLQVLS